MTIGLEEQIVRFRNSVAPDLYLPADILNWDEIEREASTYADVLNALDSIPKDLDYIDHLTDVLVKFPVSLEAIKILLSLPATVGFIDGREIPPRLSNQNQAHDVATLLNDLGFWHVIKSGSIKNSFKVALIGKLASSRRFNISTRFSASIAAILQTAVLLATEETGENYKLLDKSSFPAKAKGRVDHIIAIDDRPIIGISSIFQTSTGGRQQRDLSLTYPDLQNHLKEIPLSLILIADGLGLRQTPDSVLKKLFIGVKSCMTLKQASSDDLKNSIIELSKSEELVTKPSIDLAPLIESALAENNQIEASALPARLDSAKLAFSKFISENRELGLKLSADGEKLEWFRREAVSALHKCTQVYDAKLAVEGFSKLFDTETEKEISSLFDQTSFANIIFFKQADQFFSDKYVLVSSDKIVDINVMKSAASVSMQVAPNSGFIILITKDYLGETKLDEIRRFQNILPKNVVVLDVRTLLEWSKSTTSPNTRLKDSIIGQADLAKISPYVLSSATPDRMFFGREAEEATMLGSLATNSVALLGSRRIGKTSLIKHVAKKLKEIDSSPYYLDCQTVRTWLDFSIHSSKSWGTPLFEDFKPHHLIDILEILKQRGEKVVVLLDEVDQLLDWDQKHTEDEVPEAFFRACRTASQQDLAQFVFSGERLISNKIWDAHSPHWNFCRPLPLRQLTEESARKLLITPLKSMNIEIADESDFGQKAWQFTNGHPQLLQELGDRLIRNLNQRPSLLRGEVHVEDLLNVAETYDYAEHYLETYWGQSTPLERVISLAVGSGLTNFNMIANYFLQNNISSNEGSISRSIRMLDLYGIVAKNNNEYSINIYWFTSALSYYGGLNSVLTRYTKELQ